MDHFDDTILDNFSFENPKNKTISEQGQSPLSPNHKPYHYKFKHYNQKHNQNSDGHKHERHKNRKAKLMPWNTEILSDRFTPQPFQVQLIDFYVKNLVNPESIDKNFLIFMRNKECKKYLKIMILKEFHVRLSELEHLNKQKKLVILITDMGSDVSKYVELISRHTTFKIAGIDSNLMNNIDFESNFKKLKNEAEILIININVLVEWLRKSYIKHTDIALAIFEEVSATFHNKSYQTVLEYLNSSPIIVGFGTLDINKSTNPHNIQQHLDHLKTLFNSHYVETATDLLDTNNIFNGYEPKECIQICESVEGRNTEDFEFKLREKIKNSYLFLEEMNKFTVQNAHFNTSNLKDIQAYINLLCVRVLNECVYLLNEVGIWCLAKSLLPFICQLDKLSNYVEHADKKLNSNEENLVESEEIELNGEKINYKILENPSVQQVLSLKYTSTVLRELREMCIKQFVNCKHQSTHTEDPIEFFLQTFTTPKVRSLVQLLKEPSLNAKNIHSDTLCSLILVQNKQVATSLSLLLKKLSKEDPTLSYLFPNYIIGPTNAKTTDLDHSNSECFKQEDILRKFYSGELNLLICSYEMEEKIQSPSFVNLIVRFNCSASSIDELPFDYFSYISIKTRAKTKNSCCYFFIEKDNFEFFFKQFSKFKKIESILSDKYSHLISLNRPINPLNGTTTNNRTFLNYDNCIYFINKYCIRLPSDALTQLTPKIEQRTRNQSEYQCTLYLPINSGCRDSIQSDWMSDPILAKMNVAYKACLILFTLNEVNEYIEPVTKEIFYRQKHKSDSDDEREWAQFNSYFEKVPKNSLNIETLNQTLANYMSHRPGGNKRKQNYKRKISPYLVSTSLVSTQQPGYLYAIKSQLTTPLQLDSDQGPKKLKVFGIVITKPLLEIVDFPIFTSNGEETINLELVKSSFYLTPNQLRILKIFHKFIFSNVLRMEGRGAMASNLINNPTTNKPSDNTKGYFICLLNESNFEFDWELMMSIEGCSDRTFMRIPEFSRKIVNQEEEEEDEDEENEPNGPNKPLFKFVESKYQDSVVVPYYRNIDVQPQFYCVTQIDYSLNPLSPFPVSSHSKASAFETFYQYFACKYNILITDLSQPLLIVNHPSTRLNLLTPRYMNMNACVLQKSYHQAFKADKKSSSNQIYLVPELVNLHPLSASVWRRSLCVPSILHRINSLLNMEELRREIAKSTGVGVPWYSEKFPRLEFVWDTNREIEISNVPDHEIDIATIENEKKISNNVSTEYQVDPSWNFEISEWDANCIKEINTSKAKTIFDSQFLGFGKLNDSKDCVNGWNDENFKTLFIDPNDMNFFADEIIESDFEDYEVDIHNKRDEEQEEVEQVDFDKEFDNEAHEEDNNELQAHKFTIDLTTLKADMKKKSAKLLSKLSVSSTNCNLVKGLVRKSIDTEHLETTIKINEVYYDFSLANLSNDSVNFSHKKSTSMTPFKIEPSSDIQDFEWMKNIIFTFSLGSDKTIQNQIDELKKNLNQSSSDKSLALDQKLNPSPKIDLPLNKTLVNEITNQFVKNQKTIRTRKNKAKKSSLALRNTDWEFHFSLDDDYKDEYGPGPAILLQALTLSNAGDGFDLERLETVGDSFLKQAITVYLFFTYPNIHEGKLSFLRSKQVSNYNLYKLGKRKNLQELIMSSKFDPIDSWLPPLYESLVNTGDSQNEFSTMLYTKMNNNSKIVTTKATEKVKIEKFDKYKDHILSDKSIADCVESIIGAYLITSGPHAALQVMSWFGLEVLPRAKCEDGSEVLVNLPQVPAPKINDPEKLDELLYGYEAFEACIGYKFKQPAYLLQAFTHSSYTQNTVTDCYQRLEFLGDAILDYVITRHLYEDKKRHSPGELTDLRSALVNNNIFAYLAVKYEFYKYFKYSSPILYTIIDSFVQNQKNRNDEFDLDEDFLDFPIDDEDEDEYYLLMNNEEIDEPNGKINDLDEHESSYNSYLNLQSNEFEELEVPKCLGDIFESVAGAIFLDSNKSFDTVWRVYYGLMKPHIDKFTSEVPKSPIRELLELEPETAKFEKPERTIDGKIRVTVSVFGRGKFKGIGRNYRIAKNAAAKLALKFLKGQTKSDD